MHGNIRTNAARLVAVGMGAALLVACGARVEGTYAGVNGASFLESITLKSGGKVNVQFMGMTREGTYEIEGREVTIKVANDTQVLQFDDRGCLVGGGIIGTYCRSEQAASGEREESREQRLAGAYEAGDGRDGIRLEFERDGVVRLTMREDGRALDSEQGSYQVDGNRVRIAVAGGPGLDLVREGDTLEGTVGYATLKFHRR